VSLPNVEGAAEDRVADSSRAGGGWVARVLQSDGRGILRMLWRILGKEADVMDAFQDCFCKLAAYPHGKDLASARAYAYRVASNVAIELIRVRKRREAHLPAVALAKNAWRPTSTPEVDASMEAADLREALGALAPHLRNVVILRDLSRLSYEDVGRILGIDAATARVYRRHAVVKLAECMNRSESSS
jgi:RNA polymerase sigma factor (sigma-70 family)